MRENRLAIKALKTWWAIAVSILCCTQRLSAQPAQPAFDPFPQGIASRYRFDLARNFFPDSAAYARARQDLLQRVEAFARVIPRADSSAGNLLKALMQSDSLSREVGRHYAYLSLRPAVNTSDQEAQRQLSELAGAVQPIGDQWERRLAAIDSARLEEFTRVEPRLGKYRFALRRARADARNRLSAEAEQAIAPAEQHAAGWGPALFQNTLAAIQFGTVSAPEGPLDLRRQGNQIRNHPQRSVREIGFRQNQAAIASRRDTWAFIIARTAAARNDLARQRRWPDYQAQAYAPRYLQTADVRSLLEQLAAASEVNRRIERRQVEQIRKAFGYDTVHVWDLSAPRPGQTAPRFTITESSALILAATRPLGNGYQAEMRALLDPANGRLDLQPRENRVDRPGFSTGSVGYPSLFFQGRFEGYLEDLSILAHEAGHAVQNMLMDSAGVLPRYSGGPSYFTESFAVLNELLLLEHLHRTATDSSSRTLYLDRLIENGSDVFRVGWESLLESMIYDSAAAGRLFTADEIEALTQATASRFSSQFGPGSERAMAWAQPIQFFTWPLYRLNYVLAKLLALRYLDLMHRDQDRFVAGYAKLLSNGYDAPPDELLRRFLGIDFQDRTGLVRSSVAVLEGWLAQAEKSSR